MASGSRIALIDLRQRLSIFRKCRFAHSHHFAGHGQRVRWDFQFKHGAVQEPTASSWLQTTGHSLVVFLAIEHMGCRDVYAKYSFGPVRGRRSRVFRGRRSLVSIIVTQ